MKLIMALVLVLLVMPTGSYGMDSNNLLKATLQQAKMVLERNS